MEEIAGAMFIFGNVEDEPLLEEPDLASLEIQVEPRNQILWRVRAVLLKGVISSSNTSGGSRECSI